MPREVERKSGAAVCPHTRARLGGRAARSCPSQRAEPTYLTAPRRAALCRAVMPPKSRASTSACAWSRSMSMQLPTQSRQGISKEQTTQPSKPPKPSPSPSPSHFSHLGAPFGRLVRRPVKRGALVPVGEVGPRPCLEESRGALKRVNRARPVQRRVLCPISSADVRTGGDERLHARSGVLAACPVERGALLAI